MNLFTSAKRPDLRRRPQVEALEDRLVLNHAPLGPEFQVNQNDLDQYHQANVAIASDDVGNFVVVWTDDDFVPDSESGGIDIYARIFDRDGNALTNDILVSNDVQSPFFSLGEGSRLVSSRLTVDVAMTTDGDFVIVHDGYSSVTSFRDAITVVFFDAFQSSPTSTSVITPSFQDGYVGSLLPSVTRAADGKTYVTYQSFLQSGDSQVLVQRFDASNNLTGAPLIVSTVDVPPLVTENIIFLDFGYLDVNRPAIAADDAGNFVVAYNANIAGTPAIAYRQYDAGGNALGNPQVLDDPNSSFDTTDSGTYLSVGRSPNVSNGDFVISWTLTGSTRGVFAQRFQQDGSPIGGVFQVNTTPLESPYSTSVDMGEDGSFVISYGNYSVAGTIYAQVFNPDGTPEDAEIVTTDPGPSFDFGLTDVAADRYLNQFTVTWNGAIPIDSESSQALVTARIYRAPNNGDTPDDPFVPVVDPFFDPEILAAKAGGPPLFLRVPLFEIGLTPLPATVQVFNSVAPVSLPITLRSGSQDPLRIGEISGRVFLDLNGNGIQDEDEVGLPGQRVFLDMNDNAVQEENEPGMDTDSKGNYAFTGLALTRYRVRQKLQRVAQTAPEKNGPHEVELTVDNSSVNGKDFGAKIVQVSVAPPRPAATMEESQSVPTPTTVPPSP